MHQQDTIPAIRGGQLKLCVTPSPTFSRDGSIPVADCMHLSSLVKSIKINGGGKCRWRMIKSWLSTSIWSITSGSKVPSTLEWHASYYVDVITLYTNAALPCSSGSHVYHRWWYKNAKYFCLWWTPLGDYHPWLTFLESHVELMLSSNWHVMLRLTVFEIFAF